MSRATTPPTHRPAFAAAAACLLAFGAAVRLAAAADKPLPRPGIAGCDVARPTGDYALLILRLTIPADPKSTDASRRETRTWTCVGGLRDGRMRVDDGVGLREPGGWLQAAGGKLTGAFRRVDLGAEVTIDAAIADGALSGTATVGDRSATVAGNVLSEDDLRRRNAVPEDKAWPAAQGPLAGGCAAQPTGAPTIDDLADLRMVWRCEESDVGRGMGNITRFMHTWASASTRRTGSGCASPIVAEAKVFFKYFVPTPRPADTPEAVIPEYALVKVTESSARQTMLDEAKKAGFKGDTLPTYAAEKMFQCADDVVLCIDAATGKTLWKAVVKGRGVNSQHHKAGPFDMSPAYADGRVFSLGMSGWLYAFDAATGEPLWEIQAERDFSNALLAVANVVIAPAARQWGAYDAATGKLLWTAGGGRAMSTLSAWSHDGKDHLLGIMGPAHAPAGIACLDADTGRELWRLPVNVITGGRGLGPGGISIFGDTLLVYQNNGTAKKGDPIVPLIAAYRLTPANPEPLWELVGGNLMEHGIYGPVHGESVPVVVRGKYVFTADLRVVDLATGKVVDQAEGENLLRPMNGGYMQAVEDIVLVRRDGTHGNMECGFYKIDDQGRVRPLNPDAAWVPPVGGTTTSYHHPIFYPMVDGRVFFRQENGVYCWDLRKP